ncbi:MAG: hypothetical protein A2854_04715 [Parcubacteria group bacterium RIFCSPHIGHO2_01_FULL_56_18]|nr:MAG: hypothetical protein A2854_04715 [Parcubacteria group bacterium RIFCSPHIGHO2_01_FULL_56_18]
MVLMSPFMRELRRFHPEAEITLLVQPLVFNLVEHCPYVDKVVTNWSWRWFWRRRWDLALAPRFDVDHFGANRVLWLSFARRRVWWRNADRFTQAPRHEVERNLEVLSWLEIPEASERLENWRTPADTARAEQLLAAGGGVPTDTVFAFVPGASHPAKQWDFNKFLELGEWLIDVHRIKLLVMGGNDEKLLGEELQQRFGDAVVDVTGQTTLREAGALLQRCRLYVGNDTGLMHLAAAEGVPVVALFRHPLLADARARSSPVRFRPWGVPHVVVQPREGDISTISVHDVQHAITTFIGPRFQVLESA